MTVEAAWFYATSQRVTGIFQSTIRADERTWNANFRYTDANGVEQRARTSTSSTFNTFDPGEAVPIRYRPERPDRVRLANAPRFRSLPAILLMPMVLILWIVLRVRGRMA